MQNHQNDIANSKIMLRNFNRNYIQAIAYCALATFGGLELADYGLEVHNSFLRYTGDVVASLSGILTLATSGMMVIVNRMAKKEFETLESKTENFNKIRPPIVNVNSEFAA